MILSQTAWSYTTPKSGEQRGPCNKNMLHGDMLHFYEVYFFILVKGVPVQFVKSTGEAHVRHFFLTKALNLKSAITGYVLYRVEKRTMFNMKQNMTSS